MIDIPLSLRVPPQGRYNRGIYTCYECGFEPPHYKVGSINSIFYFLHKAAEPFNCLEQDNLA